MVSDALSIEEYLAGEQYQLGEPRGVYRRSVTFSGQVAVFAFMLFVLDLVMVVFLLAVEGLAGLSAAAPLSVVQFMIALAKILSFVRHEAVVMPFFRKVSVSVYREGLLYRRGSRTRVVRWEDIIAVSRTWRVERSKGKLKRVTYAYICSVRAQPNLALDAGIDRVAELGKFIEHQALRRLAEDELERKSVEIRQHILVSDDTIRRIYEALLAGHVILTGPPGTGKTELATLLPEILWSEQPGEDAASRTGGYATKLVTASDGWSVHTLLGGLVPKSLNGQVHYHVRYGHLAETIRQNWLARLDRPHLWGSERVSVYAHSQHNGQETREFQGLWLVIDEFNRAPIDLALGEAMTTLSGGHKHSLHLLTDDGYHHLPLPKDFRILGTLNSFDRNYLNQISEALKRRFTSVEVPPPSREQWHEEWDMVLRKSFTQLEPFGLQSTYESNLTTWFLGSQFIYRSDGAWSEPYDFLATLCEQAWDVFEVIRIYRRLGTAQAISLMKQILLKVLFKLPERPLEEVRQAGARAIDEALCDVIADQLQILMRDELTVLHAFARGDDRATFIRNYHQQLKELAETSSRRLRAQLEALSMVVDEDGHELLTEQEAERLAALSEPIVNDAILTGIFHLDEERPALSNFTRRLRAFRNEHRL